MNRILSALLLATSTLVASPALADEAEAEACVRQKVWDDYGEGWSIRTLTSTTLKSGSTRNYLVTLYKGNEYRIKTCSDEGTKNIDVLLYDLEGNIVAKDDTIDGSPSFSFTPEQTATYYIVAYGQKLGPRQEAAAVAVAVTYR